MVATMLVPLDGSALAERALPFAMSLARSAAGRLVLLRVHAAVMLVHDATAEATAASTQEALAQQARKAGVEAASEVYHVYLNEEVSAAIVSVARERGATCIVMSTHGRGGVGRWLYGSVADEVIRHSPVPVLLVPSSCELASWPDDRQLSIMVPLDGSPLAEEALGTAAEIARHSGASLVLLRAVEPLNYAYAEGYAFLQYEPERELADAGTYLQSLAEKLRAEGLTVVTESRLDQAARAIEAVAAERGADLLVMATHGRGGIARFVLGSVATGVLQRVHLPLMLVPPAAAHAGVEGGPRVLETIVPPQSTISVELTARELDLVRRGLGELLFTEGRDPRFVEPTRELLARFRQLATSSTAVTTERIGARH